MENSFILDKTDENSTAPGSSFLQSRYWALLKSSFGWKPYFFNLDGGNLTVLVRSFRSLFSLAYIAHAPAEKYRNSLVEISLCIKKYLPENCIFIRFDLPWIDVPGPDRPFVKAAADIQPTSTVIVDLTKDTDTILSEMKSKTRYNIRLAGKKGVRVKRCGIETLDKWYEIYRETGTRDKIALHSPDYYRKVFEYAASEGDAGEINPDIRLYMAESEGRYIAGIVTSFYSGKAVYLYGASLNSDREKMPAYALQWKAMCDAKDEGCTEYDMFGIPPADDPDHPMHGLYRFKTGFGGSIIHRAGCYDYPLKPSGYSLYRLAEKARYFYFKKIRKK